MKNISSDIAAIIFVFARASSRANFFKVESSKADNKSKTLSAKHALESRPFSIPSEENR